MGPTMSCRLSVEYGRESAGNRRHQRDPIDFKFALGQRKREDLGIDKIERLIISGSGVRNPDGALTSSSFGRGDRLDRLPARMTIKILFLRSMPDDCGLRWRKFLAPLGP